MEEVEGDEEEPHHSNFPLEFISRRGAIHFPLGGIFLSPVRWGESEFGVVFVVWITICGRGDSCRFG